MIEFAAQGLGLMTLAFVSIKLLSLFRSCCIMWVGSTPDFTKYGRWAVVTGCTDGIGKAYAFQLARLGMDIVLISRSQNKLQDTAAQIESQYKSKTKIIDIDFTGGRGIYDRIKDALQDFDVGVLVNNVGMCIEHPEYFTQVENGEKVYRDIIECNMASVTFMTQLCLPKMVEKRKGVIINISSLSASFPCPLITTYGASKAYVDCLCHSLSNEYKDSGVIIQSVVTGQVATKMSKATKETMSMPSPTTYVKSALRTVGKLDRTTGFWFHEYELFAGEMMSLIFNRNLLMYLSRKLILDTIREKALKKKDKDTKEE